MSFNMSEGADKEILQKPISRRAFLKGAAKAGAGLAAASLVETSGTHEQLKLIPPNVVMIDFAPQSPNNIFHQKEYSLQHEDLFF